MITFFKPEDFEHCSVGASYCEVAEIRGWCAEVANAKLEASFGNEYAIVMFWKEKMLEERKRADELQAELDRCNAAERELEALKKEIDEAPVVYGQKDSAREAGWQYFGTDPVSDIGLYRARLVRIEELKKP